MAKNKIEWIVKTRENKTKQITAFSGFVDGIETFRIYRWLNKGDNKYHYKLTNEKWDVITTSYDYKSLKQIANTL